MLDGKDCWPISSRIGTVMEAQMRITLQDGRNYLFADGHVSSIEAIKVKQWVDKEINFAKPRRKYGMKSLANLHSPTPYITHPRRHQLRRVTELIYLKSKNLNYV